MYILILFYTSHETDLSVFIVLKSFNLTLTEDGGHVLETMYLGVTIQ